MQTRLFLAFFCLYLLSIGSQLYSSDAQVMYETGRALAFEQTFSLPSDFNLPQIQQGRGGRWYSQYDPGLPLLAAPVIWISDTVAEQQLWNRYAFSAYVIQWISAAGAAMGMVALYQWSMAVYGQPRIAILITVAAGVCTPVWVYARQFFAEGLLAGLLTLAFYGAYRGRWWAGLALGVVILTRAAMVIYLIPIGYLFLGSPPSPLSEREGEKIDQLALLSYWNFFNLLRTLTRKGGHREQLAPLSRWRGVGGEARKVASFLFFPALAIFGLLYHNYLRSGDPLTFGYGGQAFDHPFWKGVFGFLFAPDKSIFLFAPPLLLSVYTFSTFWRRDRRLALGMLVSAGVALVFYGSWWAWGGGWCWGPRFLIPLIPLWMLPMGMLFTSPPSSLGSHLTPTPLQTGEGQKPSTQFPLSGTERGLGGEVKRRRVGVRLKAITVCLFLLGFLINGLGILTDVNRYYARYGVVNYTQSPIIEAVRSLWLGDTEKLGAFHLQSMGWLELPAIIFPALLMFTLLIAAYGIGKSFIVEDGNEF